MAGAFRAPCLVLLAAVSAGCAPESDRVSEIETLRILAVQKDKPYARPGDTVNLSMLWRDGSDKAGRPVQVMWLAGCFNPPGDLFYSCFANLDPSALSSKTASCPPPAADPPPDPPVQQPCDNKFSFEMPSTILDRPPPSDPTQPPYGLSYVFFAACAGARLELRPPAHERDFPIACLDENGNRLGSDDFVAGYTAIYAYGDTLVNGREITNNNPEVTGFFFKDAEVGAGCADPMQPLGECTKFRCLGDECLDLTCFRPASASAGDQCRDIQREWSEMPCGQIPCVKTCEDDGDESCPPAKIRPKLTEPLASYPEEDVVSNATRNRNITEQMWINYYAEKGGVKSEVRLLNDAFEGVNEDYGTEFYAPKDPGMTVVWAVVHDNRGGMSWVGMPIRVE